MRRVVFLEPTLHHYRFRFLEALAEELVADGVRVEVACHRHAERGTFADRPGVPVPVTELPLRERHIGPVTLRQLDVRRTVGDADLLVMPQQTKLVDAYPLLARQRLGGMPIAFWGHGHTPDSVAADHPVARRLKEALSRAPHWWFAYTAEVADLVASFGYPRDRITTVGNSTDTGGLTEAMAEVTEEDLAAFDERHDTAGRPLLLFLGSYRDDKELPFLLEAGDALAASGSDALIGFSGAGPRRDLVEEAARRPWGRDLGTNYGQDLAVLLRRAQGVVVPAWVGLVAVDALAAGTPFITRRDASHPPEVHYLTHEQDSLIVDDGGDPVTFASELRRFVEDAALRARLSEGARATAERFSSEQMAASFADGIRAALKAPRR